MRSELQTSMHGKALSFLSWETNRKNDGASDQLIFMPQLLQVFGIEYTRPALRLSALLGLQQRPQWFSCNDRLHLLLLEVVDH